MGDQQVCHECLIGSDGALMVFHMDVIWDVHWSLVCCVSFGFHVFSSVFKGSSFGFQGLSMIFIVFFWARQGLIRCCWYLNICLLMFGRFEHGFHVFPEVVQCYLCLIVFS